MKTIKLKTNIMCSSCIEKVTSSLNEAVGQDNWTINTQHPGKILTVTTENLSEEAVIKAVEKAGFTAEKLS